MVAGARFERAMLLAYETGVVTRPYPRQWLRGDRIERSPLGYEPNVLPTHSPASISKDLTQVSHVRQVIQTSTAC